MSRVIDVRCTELKRPHPDSVETQMVASRLLRLFQSGVSDERKLLTRPVSLEVVQLHRSWQGRREQKTGRRVGPSVSSSFRNWPRFSGAFFCQICSTGGALFAEGALLSNKCQCPSLLGRNGGDGKFTRMRTATHSKYNGRR